MMGCSIELEAHKMAIGCVVVKDRFRDTHADTLEGEEDTFEGRLKVARDLVERLGLGDTEGEEFTYGVTTATDPGAARLLWDHNGVARVRVLGTFTAEIVYPGPADAGTYERGQ